jgi:hypothetical protein
MKAKYLIEQLKKYNPDDEIIVAYWDKEWFDDQCDHERQDCDEPLVTATINDGIAAYWDRG